jgi:hypothetical protein
VLWVVDGCWCVVCCSCAVLSCDLHDLLDFHDLRTCECAVVVCCCRWLLVWHVPLSCHSLRELPGLRALRQFHVLVKELSAAFALATNTRYQRSLRHPFREAETVSLLGSGLEAASDPGSPDLGIGRAYAPRGERP